MQVNQNQELEKYAREKGIKFIVLFGSRATGTANNDSDFDVAVYLKDDKSVFGDLSLGEYSEMLEKLKECFGFNPDKIDLTDLNSANILLRREVTVNGKLLYGDANEYENYKAFAYRDYVDAKPLFDLESLLINKRQKLIQAAFA